MWFENPFRSNDPDNLVLLLRNLGAKQVSETVFYSFLVKIFLEIVCCLIEILILSKRVYLGIVGWPTLIYTSFDIYRLTSKTNRHFDFQAAERKRSTTVDVWRGNYNDFVSPKPRITIIKKRPDPITDIA